MRGVGIGSDWRCVREASVISSGALQEKKFIGSMLFTVVPWIARAKASIFWIGRVGGGRIFAPRMRNSFFPVHLTTGGMSPHFFPSDATVISICSNLAPAHALQFSCYLAIASLDG